MREPDNTMLWWNTPGRENKAYMPDNINDTHGTMVATEAARGTQSIVVPVAIFSEGWGQAVKGHQLDLPATPGPVSFQSRLWPPAPERRASSIGWGLAMVARMAQRIRVVTKAAHGSAYRERSVLGVV